MIDLILVKIQYDYYNNIVYNQIDLKNKHPNPNQLSFPTLNCVVNIDEEYCI
jgi:hypothetical protein